MRIKKIRVKNVKNFNDITIEFNENFNILLGPNGGGKSKLLDTLTTILKHFFLSDWKIERRGPVTNIIRKTSFNGSLLTQLLDKNSEIEISFKVSQEDKDNLEMINKNQHKLIKIYKSYYNEPIDPTHLKSFFEKDYCLKTDEVYSYRIKGTNIEFNYSSKELYFYEYLQYYGLFVLLSKDIEEMNLSSNYIYFPPHRESESSSLIDPSNNFYDTLADYSNTTSKRTVSLLSTSSSYFTEKKIKYQQKAEYDGYKEKYNNDPEVKMVNDYLSKLGYKWDIKPLNSHLYQLLLTKGKRSFPIDESSSGETEILNFLLGIFAFNVKNGLIIIDEPELHLHPTWQTVLMDLFKDLAENTNNQFIFATHSPVFVNAKTIYNVIRVYSGDDGFSKVVKMDGAIFKNLKDILHIINSHNNEKMFFADKVILVEGIKDRIVFEALLNTFENKSDIIEILEVHGKINFDKYRKFLDSIKVKNYIISDLDFILDICDDNKIKSLFETNYKKIDREVLKKCKKSLDCKTLSKCLEKAIETESLEDLESFWKYINSRFINLKTDLNNDEEDLINLYIEDMYSKNLFILKNGEIEDYLPEKQKSLENTIKLMKQGNRETWLREDNVNELLKIMEIIIND